MGIPAVVHRVRLQCLSMLAGFALALTLVKHAADQDRLDQRLPR